MNTLQEVDYDHIAEVDYDSIEEINPPVTQTKGRNKKAVGGRLAPGKLSIIAKRAECLRARMQGETFQEIGHRLGMDPSTVWRNVQAAHELARQAAKEEAETLLCLEVARLDEVMRAHWDAALARDPKSTDTVLRCISERCKILGLNAPTRTEVKTVSEPEPDPNEFDLLTLGLPTEILETIVEAAERQKAERSQSVK